jgi:subtilisin family serine protease
MSDCAKRRTWARYAAFALIATAVPFAVLDLASAQGMNVMRAPNIDVGSRVPVNPTIAPRVDPNIAGRTNTNINTNVISVDRATPRITLRINPHSTMPYARTSPNLYPACDAAYRGADGECTGNPVATSGGSGGNNKSGKQAKKGGNSSSGSQQNAVSLTTYRNQFVAEIDGGLSNTQIEDLARRHGLALVEAQNFPLLGATIGLFRIAGNRPADEARRSFATEASVKSLQFNLRYFVQEAKTTEGDPAQYAVRKLKLPQAHAMAHGMNVTIAVIDSGIDVKHPELANTISDSFDALGSKEGPHVHGTGIAGAIAAHARLMGSAPEARIIAIRAFSSSPNGAESSSYIIIKSLNYAVLHGAQIVNMSFAGPKDPLIERAIAETAARGVLLVAAAGNAGPKSPPLYPAANPNVIAVSGTDAQDRLFAASNRGNYIALAAPGTDVFLPAPDEKYQMTSGTSFSAAYVSGIAALVMERNPALKPNDIRAILTSTARDLGTPGRDDLFGHGEADAFAAVTAATAGAGSIPMATAPDRPQVEPASVPGNDVSVSRALSGATPAVKAE